MPHLLPFFVVDVVLLGKQSVKVSFAWSSVRPRVP